MDPLTPSEALRLRAAFGSNRSVERTDDGHREVLQDGDSLVLRDGRDSVVVAVPNTDGKPGLPSISADGSALAFLRQGTSGDTSLETMRTGGSGLLGHLRRVTSTVHTVSYPSIRAGDLSPDGSRVAYVTESVVHLQPFSGKGPRITALLPPHVQAADVEALTNDRVAVETSIGTYYLMDGTGHLEPLPLRAFDSERWTARCRSFPGVDESLLETYGTRLQAAFSSPDGQGTIFQLENGPHEVQNYAQRRGAEVPIDLGPGPAAPVRWSPDGRFGLIAGRDGWQVCRDLKEVKPSPVAGQKARFSSDGKNLLVDDKTVPLAQIFSAWDVDLGTSVADPGDIVQQPEAIVINGVRVRRTPEATKAASHGPRIPSSPG